MKETRDLQEQKAALTRKTEELKKFAYVASHDLQEPLRIIASYLEILEEEYDDKLDQAGKIYIGKCINASNRMRTLINDLLTYSRVSNKVNPMKETDLNQVVRDVIENLEISIKQEKAIIEIENLPTLIEQIRDN